VLFHLLGISEQVSWIIPVIPQTFARKLSQALYGAFRGWVGSSNNEKNHRNSSTMMGESAPLLSVPCTSPARGTINTLAGPVIKRDPRYMCTKSGTKETVSVLHPHVDTAQWARQKYRKLFQSNRGSYKVLCRHPESNEGPWFSQMHWGRECGKCFWRKVKSSQAPSTATVWGQMFRSVCRDPGWWMFI
jgi:hypothetical protein